MSSVTLLFSGVTYDAKAGTATMTLRALDAPEPPQLEGQWIGGTTVGSLVQVTVPVQVVEQVVPTGVLRTWVEGQPVDTVYEYRDGAWTKVE